MIITFSSCKEIIQVYYIYSLYNLTTDFYRDKYRFENIVHSYQFYSKTKLEIVDSVMYVFTKTILV